MLTQFLLQNAHFALNIFAAMVFSWIFWLYLDVWIVKKTFKEFLKFSGFLMLTFSFVTHALIIEIPSISEFLISDLTYQRILVVTRLAGYILVILGLTAERSPSHPHDKRKDKKALSTTQAAVSINILGASVPGFVLASMFFPIFSAVVAILYLYRSTYGLEFHLRRVSLGFFTLSVYELLALRHFFEGSSNVSIFKLAAPFSSLWIAEHIILFGASLILGLWVFSYLLKRIQTQLYIFFSLAILFIFIV